MSDDADSRSSGEKGFLEQVGAKEARKLEAQRRVSQGIWFGLGMMGLVGWSVAVPTLLGTGLGLWLDARFPSSHSWTLTLLVAGLLLGCLNAWHWVVKENREMRTGSEKHVD